MIVELDWKSIQPDISEKMRELGRKYNEDNIYHVLLMGSPGVGKKTYINSVSSQIRHLPTEIDGITLSLAKVGKDLVNLWSIDLEMVDLESLSPMREEVNGVLGIFDLSDSSTFEIVQDGVGQLIQVYGKMYPLILVGNKADTKERDIEQEDVLIYAYELGNCSCHRVPYAEVSSKTNFGLDQILINVLTMNNCTQTSKCSQFPAAMRHWCNVPQFHSFHKESRQNLHVV